MKKLILLLITFNISAQDINSDSSTINNVIIDELNRMKVFNDSIFLNFEKFKSSALKNNSNSKILFEKLNDVIKLNYSINQINDDSLFNTRDELISKIKENINQIANQNLIQNQNSDSHFNLESIINKYNKLIMLFFALILIGLVLLTGYFNKKRSDSDLKIKEVLTSQKNLKSNFLLVSESINKLKSENNLSSEKINKILDKLKALE
mgnify:FL=1|jgi:hypothetical protein|tara:strand:- start:111 stop:734 length:624 start_codon:yes stop_codon:yes gene_type:complete